MPAERNMSTSDQVDGPVGEHTVDRPISWPRKVNPARLRALYVAYAKGIVDDDTIDAVGYALYERCRAIWCVSEVRCPECSTKLEPAQIETFSCWSCPNCAWALRKRRFRNSHRGKRLVGGSAYPAFTSYLRDFETARDPHAKMRAIDKLVHAFHGDYQGARARLRRTACVSVLEGTNEELSRMLDDLAYGDTADARMLSERNLWRRKRAEAAETKSSHADPTTTRNTENTG